LSFIRQAVFNFFMKINTVIQKRLSDLITPVSAYLKLRDQYKNVALLESTDFHSRENCMSLIGLDPLASIAVKDLMVTSTIGEVVKEEKVANPLLIPTHLQSFLESIKVEQSVDYQGFNGLFGYASFDAIRYFDTHDFDASKRKIEVPEVYYVLYRFILAFNHFNDELILLENIPEGENSQLESLETFLLGKNVAQHTFEIVGEETSNIDDEAFRELIRIGKKHCHRGDVFQIVYSRQFQQKFKGDDFNVYRHLRSINPSPYLFYFDFGGFHIMGSSPEAQLVIENNIASVNPIAGTYKRTGDDEQDRLQASLLAQDPKEQAEHIMLVDLARNDLSRNAKNVSVTKLKDIQFFSHVIHLVSKVQGDLPENTSPFRLLSDTFPAGTLSGAPKFKALELISKHENQTRGIYGGAIGLVDFNGNLNHAIMIRSFLSKNNTLYYQAGAGVVVTSDEESELQEVNNKIGALRKAIVKACK
jgi:anthranilate synthase component I